MKANLYKVTHYFSHFNYSPTFEESYTFFPIKIGKKRLKDYIDRTSRDTLGEYNNKFSRHKVGIPTPRASEKVLDSASSPRASSKFKNSLSKIQRVQKYLDFISLFPQIRLIGLSGSVAMLNANKGDDVDLFIVSAKERLWTARFITNFGAWLFGLKRKRTETQARDKVCLNLFFSESRLKISKKRRTEYMAHEVLQMVPILDINQTYRKFLFENDWIHSFFPNVSLNRYLPHHSAVIRCVSNSRVNFGFLHFGNALEVVLKKIQLLYMSKPKGDEHIEVGQLWFHPRDYSRIVKSTV